MSDRSQEAEVVVLGGGPAGASAALHLARNGLPVVLLERSTEPQWRIGETLGPSARPMLDTLGLLEDWSAEGHRVSPGNGSSWGSDPIQFTDFIASPYGSGWQLDRVRFERRLWTEVERHGVRLQLGTRMTQARREAGVWDVDWTGESTSGSLRASWIIDATGRRGEGVRRWGRGYESTDALVAVFSRGRPSQQTSPDQEARTWVESAPDGWWYSALLPDGHRLMAWMTDADLVRDWPGREREGFVEQLRMTKHLGQWADPARYHWDEALRITSAQSRRARVAVGDGWLAVGDAALSFDPLSAQGLITALLTGIRGAETILRSLRGEREAGATYVAGLESIWKDYRRLSYEHYAQERRWSDQPFWARRHRPPVP